MTGSLSWLKRDVPLSAELVVNDGVNQRQVAGQANGGT